MQYFHRGQLPTSLLEAADGGLFGNKSPAAEVASTTNQVELTLVNDIKCSLPQSL